MKITDEEQRVGTVTDDPPAGSKPYPPLTPQAYLVRERAAKYRSEYFDGEVVAMAGASMEHVRLVRNLTVALDQRFGNGPCEVYPTDLRVAISAANAYVYPDLAVVCGRPQFLDERFDVLVNPTLIVEVLSPSTERSDRQAKSKAYWALPSVREYVLVAQDRARVEVYRRAGAEPAVVCSALDGQVEMESLGLAIPMAEIYRRVIPPPAYEPRPYRS